VLSKALVEIIKKKLPKAPNPISSAAALSTGLFVGPIRFCAFANGGPEKRRARIAYKRR
jgi:hypothetical protein